MVGVYIVEDSVPTLNELTDTIDWEAFGCKVMGTATDTYKAEVGIRSLMPQLVITDVQMPLRDGLEMIEALSDLNGIYYIVISAYRLFEYAQRAIKLNTFDYILKPIDDEEFYRAIENVVHTICSRQQAGQAQAATNWSAILLSAVRYIEEHYQDNLTVGQVASHLFISESYLGKIFRREMNKSFVEYLNDFRIREAMALLRNTRHKFYEIATMVGIDNYTYFSMLFKKIVGISPMQYRQMNTKG